jgi:hypothetical protein
MSVFQRIRIEVEVSEPRRRFDITGAGPVCAFAALVTETANSESSNAERTRRLDRSRSGIIAIFSLNNSGPLLLDEPILMRLVRNRSARAAVLA